MQRVTNLINSFDLHFNSAIFYLYFITIYFYARNRSTFSGFYIIVPRMQRTLNIITLQKPLSQRTLAMFACIIYCIKLSLDIKQSYLFSVYLNHLAFAISQILFSSNIYKIRHFITPNLIKLLMIYKVF